MDSREFAAMAKQYAVDQVVEGIVARLKSPRLSTEAKTPHNEIEHAISRWINEDALAERRRSEWFNRLKEDDQKILKDTLEDCAERAAATLFCLIDGVDGSYEGVFEIVAVDSANRRIVLNPGNAEMLHDVFSDVCEEGRRRT